jgi:protein ImuB
MKRGGVLTLSPDTLMFERELSRENDLMREVSFFADEILTHGRALR